MKLSVHDIKQMVNECVMTLLLEDQASKSISQAKKIGHEQTWM